MVILYICKGLTPDYDSAGVILGELAVDSGSGHVILLAANVLGDFGGLKRGVDSVLGVRKTPLTRRRLGRRPSGGLSSLLRGVAWFLRGGLRGELKCQG